MSCLNSPQSVLYSNLQMSRCLKTRIPIPSKARGERKLWSDPILIETQLPGAFCPLKRHKIGPTSMATEIIESAILPDSRYKDD